MANLNDEERKALQDLANLEVRRRFLDYKPYAKQRLLHKLGATKRERAILAGNQLGKTMCAGYEIAMHLTGRYPAWWEGRRFDHPIDAWAGGVTSISVRDIISDKLFGKDWSQVDHGIILPEDIHGEPVMSRGVPGLMDTIHVNHVSGGVSTLQLKSYEQGREKWQGTQKDFVWLDEEPPVGIYAEALARTNATGGELLATFTPLMGMTEVVLGYWELGPYDEANPDGNNPDKAMVLMGIRDVEHYSEQQKQTIINSYPAFEREARANGIPSLGTGRVFTINEDDIKAPTPEIPEHWPRICGLDIGWDHPTAAAWLAWDRDTDIVYLYDCYKTSQEVIGQHAMRIRQRGEWIPVAWPLDALQSDKTSGESIAEEYRKAGVNMLFERATLPNGSNSVEASLHEMDTRMRAGTFKVAPHLTEWLEEFNLYHRDNGKIVKKKDDLISATRYALMMLRFAQTKDSATNAEIDYDLSWIV